MTSASSGSLHLAPEHSPPTGFVTFLFTDIQGSTKLWERFPETMAVNLARHDRIMREAIAAHNGYVFKTIGDAFCAAFPTATDGLNAALDAQRALFAADWGDTGPIRVRMALNSGEPECRDNDYFGPPVNRVARLLATGHGGQVLVSATTQAALDGDRLPDDISLRLLGEVRLKDLAQREPVYQLIAPDLPQVFPKLKTPPRPYTGVAASVLTSVAGLLLYQFVSSGFSGDVVTSPRLLDSLKGSIIELSAVNELSLLGLAGLILLALIGAFVLRHHATAYRPGRSVPAAVQFTGQFVSMRTIGFLAGSLVLVLGAFGYQQYLWRVELPIPDDAIGIALTREAAAASISDELEEALFVQGDSDRIVIRELPVRFDAGDIDRARELGKRIGARAVVIYRSEANDDRREYTAYVVFTDPAIGVTVGTTPVTGGDGTTIVQQGGIVIQQSVPVPVLRTASLAQLVDATAGIIAHEEGRHRDAIELLEEARAADSAGRDIGLINYYLGSAYWSTSQTELAAEAYEQAISSYEERRQSGRLPAQDTLILARAYLDLGRVRMSESNADATGEAQPLFEAALALREELLSRRSQLEQPSDIHVTFTQVYAMLADVYRQRGQDDEQQHWERRAREEAQAITGDGDEDDAALLVRQAAGLGLAGDCFTALEATDRALAVDGDNLDALILSATLQHLQGYPDLAIATIERALEVRPDSVTAHELAGLIRFQQAFGDGSYVEPAYLLEAETRFNDLIAVDPSNVRAHQWIGDIAKFTSSGQQIDSTAVSAGDEVNIARSSTLWGSDPTRHAAAVDALGNAIEQYRIIAYELAPSDHEARMTLAGLYVERMSMMYYHLPFLQATGEGQALERYLAQIGEDMTRVREATDGLRLGEVTAQRVRVIEAWSHFVQALEYETTRVLFYETDTSDADTTDDERAQALLDEWTAAIDDALTVIEAEPLNGPEEQYAASFVYLKQALVFIFYGDDAAAREPQATFMDLQSQVAAYYRERGDHTMTLCADMREVERGDALLAADDTAGAIDAYEAAIELHPDNLHALEGVAAAYYRNGDAAGASDLIQTAAYRSPDDPERWMATGLYALADGDSEMRDMAYERSLSLLAERPPQERMALAKRAVGELQELVLGRMETGGAALEVVPRFSDFLDGMTDAGDTYQYPQLYAELGKLALLAGDTAGAINLLERSIELDGHQPIAKMWLALAVVANGDPGDEEIDALTGELDDPLWEETASVEAFGRSDLLEIMEAELDELAAARPDFAEAIAKVRAAIEV